MTGTIVFSKLGETTTVARGDGNDFEIEFLAGEKGARFALNGKDRSGLEGQFLLQARNDVSTADLVGKPDGTLAWNGVNVLTPVGTVIAFAANFAPSGYLLCNGGAVSRTTYATLFSVIGTTYGAGDGSTTFNLPNLTDKFIQGSSTAGTVKNAGLPAISGRTSFGPSAHWVDGGGAFTAALRGTKRPNIENGNGDVGIGFDASRSNSIYGNSDTVQPPALTMRYYIKY